MKKQALYMLLLLAAAACSQKPETADYVNRMRPSAVPLATVDPYFSVWSFSDRLNEDDTRHWTGKKQPLQARVRVDGTVYRVMGTSSTPPQQVAPTAKVSKWDARYVITDTVAGSWFSPGFDDSRWNEGEGAFGSASASTTGTEWNTAGSIYIRRSFVLDSVPDVNELVLECSHDESFELYINGIQAASSEGYSEYYEIFPVAEKAAASLHEGENIIACRCKNAYGAACIDFGISCPVSDGESAAVQNFCNTLPTRTLYGFTCGPVDFSMTFMTPLLMDNLDIMSRPVSYVTYSAVSNDGKEHDVQFMFSATPAMAVNNVPEPVVSSTGQTYFGIRYAKCGTVGQRILARKGDDVRIDWGYFYLASEDGQTSVLPASEALGSFRTTGNAVSPEGQSRRTENFETDPILLTVTNDLGRVGELRHGNYLMLAYDDVYSVQYFWHNLRPWWNRTGNVTVEDQIDDAVIQYDSIKEACRRFDNALMEDAVSIGGTEYADLLAVAYRQAVAANKLVQSPEGELLLLSKENFSNGSIGTVDITYPSSPLFLLYNPELAKGLLNPIFRFSESGRWTKPFAAHDVGTYPIANGQTYGGDMPVEESGNVLIVTAAIAKAEGDPSYAEKHWETLTTWAEYLLQFGLDPEEQLCTDDFAGHFAHNANLSAKAILAIASYAYLAGELGYEEVSDRYMSKARGMAAQWKTMASDGDHYRLTFDKPGTWSQKYNMVWDPVLGLDVFDKDIFTTETSYYLTRMNRYGLPLDSRKTYTKIDWILWSATMSGDRKVFDSLVSPVWDFENDTPDRLPMSDWVYSDRPNPVGFRARSVVGGLFMPLLKEKFENSK